MFIELHLLENDEKIILNINNFISIYQTNGKVNIYTGEVVYQVKESYEDIVECIDKYYKY